MLKSRIPLITAQLKPELLEGIKEGAEAIVKGAQDRVPVDTGALRDAIHVEADETGVRVVAGDGDAYYGHIVEMGSVYTSARPFLIPAFEAERDNLLEIAGEKLKDL